MAIVLTGFGPFGQHKVNASWEAVRLVPGLWEDTEHPVVVEEIPVDYSWVQAREEGRWKEAFFTVHVGVSHLATAVTLECRGHNTGYCRPDVAGACPPGETCQPDGLEEITTCLDMPALLAMVEAAGADTKFELSEDAGRYLCDFVYYRSLLCSQGRSLFIHVPPLDTPYSAQQLARAIAAVLRAIVHIRVNT